MAGADFHLGGTGTQGDDRLVPIVRAQQPPVRGCCARLCLRTDTKGRLVSEFRDRHEKTAKLAERTVKIVLDPAAAEALDDLRAKVSAMARQPATLEGDPAAQVKREYADVQAKVAEEAEEFRLRALPWRAFAAVKLAHPPRDDNPGDAFINCNVDEVSEILIRRCTVEPVMDAADWAWLIGDGTDENPGILSAGQYDKLADAAWSANRTDVDVPLLLAASDHLPNSSDE